LIGWLLDTNVVSALVNPAGAPSVKRWAGTQDEETFFLSVLSLAEYDQGIHNLDPTHPALGRFRALRDGIERRFAGRILSLDDRIVRRWGAMAGEIRRSTKRVPPVVDTLIAATAMEHDLFLVTRNTRDVIGTGVAVFNPWVDDPSQYRLAR
jgi:predicted nucleic acid-binding protein